MGVSRFNSEGCCSPVGSVQHRPNRQVRHHDPTPHEAVFNMDKEAKKWRPLVYVCSPYAGDVRNNTENARRYCRFAVDAGAIPLAPHLLLPQFLSEETERELALFMGMVLLGRCEEVWVFGERVTDGMAAEIAKAEKRKMKVRYFTDGMEERK